MQMIQPLTSNQISRLIALPDGKNNISFYTKKVNVDLGTGDMIPTTSEKIIHRIYWRKSKRWVAMVMKFLSLNNPGMIFQVKYW